MFSKQNNFVGDGFKTTLTYIEKFLSFIKIDVEGAVYELWQDEEFLFYLKMVSCEINISLSPSQILLLKIMKNYYIKYHKNK
jgi:hypothetical protein